LAIYLLFQTPGRNPPVVHVYILPELSYSQDENLAQELEVRAQHPRNGCLTATMAGINEMTRIEPLE
jgi:hypothetical protein